MWRVPVAVILFLLAAPGCTAEPARTPQGEIVFSESVAPRLNHLTMRCQYGSMRDCEVDIWYPPQAVLAEIDNSDGSRGTIEYESCYELSGGDIPREVMGYRCGKDRIYEVPHSGGVVDGYRYVYGKLGEVVYRFNWPVASESETPAIERFLESHKGVLHESAVIRADALQLVDSSWIPLTRYRFGGGMGFWPAPADTMHLRAKFGAFRTRYYNDRVVIEAREVSGALGLSFDVMRPSDGYWPPTPIQAFFREHKTARVGSGQEFRWDYQTRCEPIVLMYTLDVHLVKDGIRDPMRCVLVFCGPSMTQPSSPEELSDWPLILAEMKDGRRLTDLGYPGGALVPRWAVEKLLDLGPLHTGSNAENEQAYGALVEELVESRRSQGPTKGE